jgi:hypothetical protein
MINDNDQVGTYFKCFRGANSHFALSEPNSFALKDTAGRDWICYPVPPKVVENLDMLSDLVDVERADDKAGEETIVRLLFCRHRQELPAALADQSLNKDDE